LFLNEGSVLFYKKVKKKLTNIIYLSIMKFTNLNFKIIYNIMSITEMEKKIELIEWTEIPQDAKDELLWILAWNELNKDEYEDADLFDAHKFHEELWFVPGAYVKLSYESEVWQIVDFNHDRGLYTWVRYPLKIKFERGTFEWGVYSSAYEQVIWYNEKFGSAEAALHQIDESPMLQLVESEDAEIIIDLQRVIKEMTDQELRAFVESGEIEEIELPHIKEFLEDEVEKRTRPERK